MIFPLIEFGGVFFCVFLLAVGLVEASWIYLRAGSSVITLLIVSGVFVLSVVDGVPVPQWQWVAGYVVGAFVWIPIYWYLILRRNRRGLLDSKSNIDRRGFGELDTESKQWLPAHPEFDDIVANGMLWFIAAPVHAAQDWIRIIIDMFSGLMGRIRVSLAVAVDNDK